MNRRRVLSLFGHATVIGTKMFTAARVTASSDLLLDAWELWKTEFLAPDGRVIDHLQGNASHSEGQGYGMLLAEALNDSATFNLMREWTETNLAVRTDPLLAWRWRPNDVPHIADYNNATDGDLFFAWALIRGARRFGLPHLAARAEEIARFLEESAVVPDPRNPDRVLLLPAMEGALARGKVLVNLSYCMPLALRELGTMTDQPRLGRCASDAVDLIQMIAKDGPIPNWITVLPSGWAPSDRHPPISGYDALRIPLWLFWSGSRALAAALAGLGRPDCSADDAAPVPTARELGSRNVLETSTSAGYRAVWGLSRCGPAGVPPYVTAQTYYPATLQMLSMVAAREAAPEP